MWDLKITKADNGFGLRWEEEDEDGRPCLHEEVIQDDDMDDLKSGQELLWHVINYFSLGGSRHDKERLHISRKRGDKYMPPEKPNEKA